MLNDKAMRNLGKTTLGMAQNELFGVKKSEPMKGMRLFLYSFAYSKSVYLTTAEINQIDRRVSEYK